MKTRAKGRNVSGIVLLDKPLHITSNTALQRVKRLFQASKAGHTGSLDPLASGLLPICLGEATKVSGFLLDTDKRYRAVCQLGVTTTTGDREGQILRTRPLADIDRSRLDHVLADFIGVIEQIPPMFSALKQHGQPLYKLAQRGLTVERAPRSVHIHSIDLIAWQPDQFEVEVSCSKGTYIRTLAEDIGERLGCGAHLSALRRTGVGGFDASRMVDFERLQALAEQGLEVLDEVLIPMQAALAHWPEVNLSDDAAFYLSQGQAVFVPRTPGAGWVKLFTGNQRFLGLGQVLQDGRVAPKRLVASGE